MSDDQSPAELPSGTEAQEALRTAREVVLGGLMIALGIVVPLLFHALGTGPVWLPMHFPVLVLGMLMSPGMAALAAAITPLASAALTGMPPIAPPTAFMMTAELAAIAAAASIAHRHLGLGPWLATAAGIACGRAVYALELFVLAPVLGIHLPAAAAGGAALLRGLPGLVLQMIVVPPIVAAVERARKKLRHRVS